MSLVILTKLLPRTYQISPQFTQLTPKNGSPTASFAPFIGVQIFDPPQNLIIEPLFDDPKPQVGKLGFGLLGAGQYFLHGSSSTQELLASWRAMLILSHLTMIDNSTFQTVNLLSKRSAKSAVPASITETIPNIEQILEQIFNSPFPKYELDHVLETCNDPDNPIRISIPELSAELAANTITLTEEVRRAISLSDELDHEEKILSIRCQQPLPKEESMQALFRQASIKYPSSPDRRNLQHLDEEILRNSLLGNIPTQLYCTDRPHNPQLCGHPVVYLINNERLILLRARYHETDGMLIAAVNIGCKPAGNAKELIPLDHIARQTQIFKLGSLTCRSPRFTGITTRISNSDGAYLTVTRPHERPWQKYFRVLFGA